MKQIAVLFFVMLLLFACAGSKEDNSSKKEEPKSSIKDGKGVGEFKNVELNFPLDEAMITTGEAIYDLKCAACHRLNDKRLVGPGFKNVTERRKPEWILNMITNVEIMLDEDPEAQKLFQECLTRMPNQNVKSEDAMAVLEFLRKNDEK